MKTREAFCSSCGRAVRLTNEPGPLLHGQATLRDGREVVCLDYDRGCTAEECVLTGRPGIVMAYRLARSHLDDDRWTRIRGRCAACGEVADLEKLDDAYVFCTICETTSALEAVEVVEG